MEIKQGDIIKYSFPFPLSSTTNSFVGFVDFIGDDFVFLKSRGNIRVKVSFKNFNNIQKLGSVEEPVSVHNKILVVL